MKKKQKKSIYTRIRKTWKMNPKTRVRDSNKIYNRNKKKTELKNIIKKTEGD